MTGAVHQFVATAEPGAVGSHTLELQRLVREELGVASEIFTEHRRGPFTTRARDFRDYGGAVAAGPDDVLVYQMAIGSVVADYLAPRPERLILEHHNLTPVRFLQSWDPGATYGVEWGVRQLHDLAGRSVLGIGDSRYNERDLIDAGYPRTAVCPVLFDLEGLAGPGDDALADRLARTRDAGGVDWLFTGRVSAHKCQHLLVRALAAYRRLYDPAARLTLVGGPTDAPYVDAVRRYAAELGLGDAVTLTGPVSHAELVTYYRHADVFVSLSEHEGFCVPLIEAMWHRIPVVALGSSAIPETVGDGGLVLPFAGRHQPGPATVAAAVHRVLDDAVLRTQLVAAGAARAEHFSLPHSRRRMLDVLATVTP
jgi:glycosyltransferase involved in cell wall biosynthesis